MLAGTGSLSTVFYAAKLVIPYYCCYRRLLLAVTTVPLWAQCGGRSTTPFNGLPGCGGAGRECVDAPWSGVRCPSGSACVRNNEWWWGCTPSTTPPPATGVLHDRKIRNHLQTGQDDM